MSDISVRKMFHPGPVWVVYNPDDSVRCQSGSEYDAQVICNLNPGCRYSLLKSLPDQVVDIPSTGSYDKVLEEQKILEPCVPQIEQSLQVPMNLK